MLACKVEEVTKVTRPTNDFTKAGEMLEQLVRGKGGTYAQRRCRLGPRVIGFDLD